MATDPKRGSQWNKWDLHVHTPLTKCNDNFKVELGKDLWDEFCDAIEKSDIEAVGITDYFSFDGYFTFLEKFSAKYPDSTKIFFPCIEVRLNETVNSVSEEVNVHLIFKPGITKDIATKFLSALKTVKTDKNGREISCDQLIKSSSRNDFEGATVTRKSILNAVKEVFGEKIIRQDYLLILAAVNNDGARPEKGKQRKETISDEIDKFCDAFFGGSQNVDYFLKTDRYEDKDQIAKEKPVFSGCDAHNFDDLQNWLGKTICDKSTNREITWIKGDLTYEGLLQVLIEPKERIKINANKPDSKELYKVIDWIEFTGTSDFPKKIVLNANLVSIIGSRSSGKSALLNYIAHAVDNVGVENLLRGPAAKIAWQEVTLKCIAHWADGSKDGKGKIVFLPQGYLSGISEKPEEITEKIKPVLFRKYPLIEADCKATFNSVDSSNKAIEQAIKRWFGTMNRSATIVNEIKSIGDKTAITTAKDEYQRKIDEIKTSLCLSDQEIKDYQKITSDITSSEEIIKSLSLTRTNLVTEYIDPTSNNAIDISLECTFNPSLDNLPQELRVNIENLLKNSTDSLIAEVKTKILSYKDEIGVKIKQAEDVVSKLNTDNKDLIEKNKKNEQLSKLIEELNKQEGKLTSIKTKEDSVNILAKDADADLKIIETNLQSRQKAIDDLLKTFISLDQSQNEIVFGVECSFSKSSLDSLAEMYNRKETKVNGYLKDGFVDLNKVRISFKQLLHDIYSGKISLKSYENPQTVAINTLTFSEETRFTAVMEGDIIGGFSESSMTPGKQALFALTLILDESDDAWPLLIDQPEDDLDSRSIYDHIATYFRTKKKERQIIMVSHNANLVVGADSEQIVVANKHGEDRKNENNQMFDYLAGSIENTCPRSSNNIVLKSCGVREHACDILDGGEEAFAKRKNKYKI